MNDYIFSTTEPMSTNSDTMMYFLNTDEHFYARFDSGAQIILDDGSYVEVENGDGEKYEVHAGGDGDFYNHRITFKKIL
jgi:hypothetical protein